MTDQNRDSNLQPSVDAIALAYDEVLQHNRSNTGFGGLFGGILSAAMEAEEVNPDAPAEDIYSAVNKKLEENADAGDMKGDLQTVLHDDAFMRIGLKLSPDGLFITSGDNKRASSVELKPQLDNTELFAEFIEGLDKDNISDNQTLLKLVGDVNAGLIYRINLSFGGYDFSEYSQEHIDMLPEIGEDALRSFVRLEQAYEKVGIIKPESHERILSHEKPNDMDEWQKYNTADQYKRKIETLQNYVEYWGRGVLPELIKIGTPESNQPVVLAYFDGLQHRLVEDIDSIIEVVKKENSHEFGLEVATSKIKSLEETLKLMDNDTEHWIVNEKNRKLIEDNLAKLRSAISN